MPLLDGYGVLSGTLHSFACDTRRSSFHYYHCTIMVSAPRGLYRCVVNLDGKRGDRGIRWKVVELPAEALPFFKGFRDGWRDLPPDSGSGALDYCRSSLLEPSDRCVPADMPVGYGEDEDCKGIPWKSGTGSQAFRDLRELLDACARIHIFGEPFRRGRGVHNIHQNQGDPAESRWAAENGPWQDGGIVVRLRDDTLSAFLCRFGTQIACNALASTVLDP